MPPNTIEPFYLSLDILEVFLAKDSFLDGKNLTIADILVAVSVLMVDTFAPQSIEKHPKILAWLKRIRETAPAFYEINAKKLQQFKQLFLAWNHNSWLLVKENGLLFFRYSINKYKQFYIDCHVRANHCNSFT